MLLQVGALYLGACSSPPLICTSWAKSQLPLSAHTLRRTSGSVPAAVQIAKECAHCATALAELSQPSLHFNGPTYLPQTIWPFENHHRPPGTLELLLCQAALSVTGRQTAATRVTSHAVRVCLPTSAWQLVLSPSRSSAQPSDGPKAAAQLNERSWLESISARAPLPSGLHRLSPQFERLRTAEQLSATELALPPRAVTETP